MKNRFLSATFCIAALAFAQAPEPQSPSLSAVTLNVEVTDKSGQPVHGLQQADFTILDNKKPRPILSFHAAETRGPKPKPPVEVLILLDQVNSSFSDVATERLQVTKFLQRDNGELRRPVSLAFLSDRGIAMGTAPTADGKALAAELNSQKFGLREIGKAQGGWGAADRLRISLQGLAQIATYENAKPGRKLLVWISPGWPVSAGNINLTAKDRQQVFNLTVAAVTGLRQADITLYSVDPIGASDATSFAATYYRQYVKGLKSSANAVTANLGLQVLAAQSGGRVLYSDNDLTSEIAECMADAASFYVITFEPSPAMAANQLHSIELKIDTPGAVARTLTTYYSVPAGAGR